MTSRPDPPDTKRCVARRSRSSERCRQWRVKGSTVCRTHGGLAPQVKAKARERVAEQAMSAAFGRLADRSAPITDPWSALEALAGDVVAWKDFAAGQIADLEKLRTIGDLGIEQVDARVSVFERALSQCTSTLTAIARLNIDDRRARVDERRADAIIRAVNAGLRAAGVEDPERVEAARVATVRELRAV